MDNLENVKQFKANETPSPAPHFIAKVSTPNSEMIAVLNQSLAHAIDLRSRTKQAYWSAKGGSFYALHKMFDDFSDSLDSVADELATRVMALGGVPVWTQAAIEKTSKLPAYPAGAVQALDHLDALIASYEAASRHLPPAMAKAVQAGDHATASIVTSFAKLLDEQAGFVAAHVPVEWIASPRKQTVS